jgi:hypothetical protein
MRNNKLTYRCSKIPKFICISDDGEICFAKYKNIVTAMKYYDQALIAKPDDNITIQYWS